MLFIICHVWNCALFKGAYYWSWSIIQMSFVIWTLLQTPAYDWSRRLVMAHCGYGSYMMVGLMAASAVSGRPCVCWSVVSQSGCTAAVGRLMPTYWHLLVTTDRCAYSYLLLHYRSFFFIP